MSKYSKFAWAVVNRYIGSRLEADGVMAKELNIGGDVVKTIIPGGQTQEMNNTGTTPFDRSYPYIAYSVSMDQHDKEWSDCEELNYAIYADSATKVLEIMQAIRDYTRRNEYSARALNAWQINNETSEYFYFASLKSTDVVGPIPVRQEGGRWGAIISISYEYTSPIIGDGIDPAARP